MKMNPVVHFEMPAQNTKRMQNFYAKAFGWKMKNMGEKYENYVVAQTTEIGKDHFPLKPGRINGGFYRKANNSVKCPSVVIAVDDINEHIRIVKKAGGKVLGKPSDIPNVGIFVSFVDTEGNIVSMIQPNPNM